MTPKARDWPAKFLKTLADVGNVRLAAAAAGCSRQAVYQRREKDEAFAAAWDRALEDAADLLEAAAYERAKAGSDVLLIFLLKHLKPAKFLPTTRTEITGPNGGPVDFRSIAAALDGKLALLAARIGAEPVPEFSDR